MKQAKYTGRGRRHGRRAASGRQYSFRARRWTDIPHDEDAEYFADVDCLEIRDKPTTDKAKEAAETAGEAASGFLAAVRQAGGSVSAMLEGMAYDQKHEAADELDADVAGNASHEELDDAIAGEVERLKEAGELET